MKKEGKFSFLLVLISLVLLLISLTSISSLPLNVNESYTVYDCTTINESGTYTLNQTLTTISSCFNITVSNVTLDLNNFNITGDDNGKDYGIYAFNQNNITIKNGLIKMFGRISSGSGIYFNNINNSLIQDIDLLTTYYGIYSNSSYFNNITNIKVSNSIYAMHLINSLSNTLTNINLSKNWEGIYLLSSSSNNSITNLTTSSNDYYAILLSSSSSNTFKDIISSYNNYGIDLQVFSLNNTFINARTNSNRINGIRIQNIASLNTFINIASYNNTNREIFNTALGYNTLIYNNSFGEIKWVRDNITTEGELTFPGNISITNNSAYFNPTGMITALNSSANITLRGLDGYDNPIILKDGVQCSAQECNILSHVGNEITFNVSSWSNYSIFDEPDTTPPIIDNIDSLFTNTTVTINFTTSELANSTINYGSSLSLGSNVSNSSFALNHSVYLVGLTASTLYYYNITVCDSFINCNTFNYTFTTSANPDSEDDGGDDTDGSSGGGAQSSNKTYIAFRNQTNSSLGYNKNLILNDRIIFYDGKQNHTLTIFRINNKNVSFIIQSSPQYFNLTVGGEKKLSLVNSNYYDFSIKVNSILNGRVNVTIKEISELISQENNSMLPQNILQNSTNNNFINKINKNYFAFLKNPYVIWVLILLGFMIVAYLISYLLHRHRKRKYYFYGYY